MLRTNGEHHLIPFYKDENGNEYLIDLQLEAHPEWKALVEAIPFNRGDETLKYRKKNF